MNIQSVILSLVLVAAVVLVVRRIRRRRGGGPCSSCDGRCDGCRRK